MTSNTPSVALDCSRLERVFRRCMQDAPYPEDRYQYCTTANAVSTVCILDPERARKRLRKGAKCTQGSEALDLMSVARYFPASSYRRTNFAAAVLRYFAGTTALVFTTGRMVVVKAGHPALGLAACHAYRLLLGEIPMLVQDEAGHVSSRPLGDRFCFKNWLVCNIVAVADIGGQLDVAKIAADKPNVQYVPERFPGGILTVPVLDDVTDTYVNVKVLLFDSGRMPVVGARTEQQANEVAFTVRRELRKRYLSGTAVTAKGNRSKKRMDRIYRDPVNMAELRRRDPVLWESRRQKAAMSWEERQNRMYAYLSDADPWSGSKFIKPEHSPGHGTAVVSPDIDVRSENLPPLIRAVMRGSVRAVQILLELCADPRVEVNGYTPLTLAHRLGHREIEDKLLYELEKLNQTN